MILQSGVPLRKKSSQRRNCVECSWIGGPRRNQPVAESAEPMKHIIREIEQQIAKIEGELERQNAAFADAINEFGTDEEIAKLKPLTRSKLPKPKAVKMVPGGFFRC